MADRGMGFLTSQLSAPEGQIDIEEADTEEQEDTAGKPGFGRVINGMDQTQEHKLYHDLKSAYWYENGFRHVVALAIAGGSLYLSSRSLDVEAGIYAMVTLVVTVTYLRGN